MEKTIKSIATNYGLYLGATLALITVIVYAVDLKLFVDTLFGISIYIIVIVFGIIAVIKSKQLFNGYLSFKETFTSYFLTVLIGLVISSLVSFLLFNFIDVEAANVLKEQSIEKIIKILEGFNTPNEIIAETVDKIEGENLFSIGNVLQSLIINYLLPITVIGLIVAAFMKKTNPDTE